MAIAKLTDPIAELRGQLKNSDTVYARMLNGKCVLQHKPQHSSPKQQAMRKAFGEKYKGQRKAFPLRGEPAKPD